MKVVIHLGSSAGSQITLDLPTADPSVDEILAEVRLGLNPWQLAVMERGINGLENGVDSLENSPQELPVMCTLFLCLPPVSKNDSPVRLEGELRVSDYGLTDGCILQLMCSSIVPDD
jgi:hypothetical protein